MPLCAWGICYGPWGSIQSRGLKSHVTAAAPAAAHSGRPQESPVGPGSLCRSLVSLFRVATFRVGYLLWPAGLDSKQGAKKSCHSSRHCSSGLRSTSGEHPAAWQPLQVSGEPFSRCHFAGGVSAMARGARFEALGQEVLSQRRGLGSFCDFWTSGADSAQPGPQCVCVR